MNVLSSWCIGRQFLRCFFTLFFNVGKTRTRENAITVSVDFDSVFCFNSEKIYRELFAEHLLHK